MKHIVEEIWKIAQSDDFGALPDLPPAKTPPPAKTTPATTPTKEKSESGGGIGEPPVGPGEAEKKPKPKPKPKYRPRNKAVIEMQRTMQKFSNYIMGDVKYSDMPIRGAGDINREEASEGHSRGSFMDWLVQNLAGETDERFRGVEWSDDPNVKKQEEKKKGETGLYEAKVVLDTINRIGSESKEFNPDGRFEWRTYNGLKNILAFAIGLFRLSREMNVRTSAIDMRHLSNFESNLNKIEIEGKDVKLNTKQETEYAKFFTKYIEAILNLYKDVREQVMGNSSFRTYLEEDKPFAQVTPESQFDKQKKEIIKNRTAYQAGSQDPTGSQLAEKVIYVTAGEGKPITVPISALTSTTNYLSWAERMGFPKEKAVNLFTGFIKPEIDKRYNTFQSEQTKAEPTTPPKVAPEKSSAPATTVTPEVK